MARDLRDPRLPWERNAQRQKQWDRSPRTTSFDTKLRRLVSANRVEGAAGRATGSLYRAEVTVLTEQRRGKTTWAVSAANKEIPESLLITRERGLEAVNRFLRGDIKTGDDDFDQHALVRGVAAEALSVLSPNNRAALCRLVANGGEVRDQAIHWMTRAPLGSREPIEHVKKLARLAGSLGLVGASHLGLLRNGQRDPSAGVRLRNLEVLAEIRPQAMADVRVVRALAHLAATATDASRTIRGLLGVAVRQDKGVLFRLDQTCLLLLLEDEPFRIGAVRRLAAVGDHTALPPIVEATTGLFTSRALSQVGREAVRAITDRHGQIEGGGLTLSDESQAGGLSTADGDGATSLVD